jgi:hypothetical protein
MMIRTDKNTGGSGEWRRVSFVVDCIFLAMLQPAARRTDPNNRVAFFFSLVGGVEEEMICLAVMKE